MQAESIMGRGRVLVVTMQLAQCLYPGRLTFNSFTTSLGRPLLIPANVSSSFILSGGMPAIFACNILLKYSSICCYL